MLESILNQPTVMMSVTEVLLCTGVSLFAGVILSCLHMYKNRSSRSFRMTIILLPVTVQMVIMLVNGNLGTGIAVMGAFGLIRFRSMAGNAREINSIFLAMAVGLADAMGYIGACALLVCVAGVVTLVFYSLPDRSESFLSRQLRVTIPEGLDYSGIFDDIFRKYTSGSELVQVRTVNMGSLYELCYRIVLKSEDTEKLMIDEIRCRNGNLSVVCGRAVLEESCL